MFVKRRESAKRKRRIYEAIEFNYGDSSKSIRDFLEDNGKLQNKFYYVEQGDWIELKDGRIITPSQYLLKDRNGKILSLDLTIFYSLYEWNI